jgi:hypothetical protein
LKIVRFLAANTTNTLYLAAGVSIFNNIAAYGSDAQTDACLDAHALEAVLPLLDSASCEVVEQVCGFLSNVAAGNEPQVQKLIDSGCVRKIITVSRYSLEMNEGETSDTLVFYS